MNALPVVNADINYVQPVQGLVYDQTHMGAGGQELVDHLDRRNMPIYDGRAIARVASLDTHGFQIAPVNFNFSHFTDEQAVREHLYPQVIDYLKANTGADFGLLFDHTVRSTQGTANSTLRRAPVKTVHNDYTDYSGEERVRIELEKVGQRHRINQRYIFVNLWMPIFDSVEESPLAIGDGRTFSEDDFHDLKLIYRDREGVIAGISHSPAHKWYYLPTMRTDEAYLLKVYDSDKTQAVRWAPHTAFSDPSSSDNAKARTSIEIRSILFFE